MVSAQLTLTLIYVPPTASLLIQPSSTSAVAILLSSVSPSRIKKITKWTTKPRDIRLNYTEKYENFFPDFYNSASKNGWICKVCLSVATEKDDQAFVERPGNIGDQPTEHFSDYLKTKRYKEATKNNMTYFEMCNYGTNVWKLALEASIMLNTTIINCNRFSTKSFICIIHSMMTKNWAYTHNFCDAIKSLNNGT